MILRNMMDWTKMNWKTAYTGATKSVISESYYRDLMLQSPKQVYNIEN